MDKLDFTVSRLGELQISSPLKHTDFLNDDAKVIYSADPIEVEKEYKEFGEFYAFEKAGPREKIYHDPSWSKAAILTAGGLCPGLNDVIKGLTNTLKLRYKVPIVYGIRYGYAGLNPEYGYEPMILNEENVDDIHCDGGTILGSSRGRQDEKIIVDTLVRMNINMLFCIGGDGTLRCAHDVAKEIAKRKLSISIIGIPKTIDNDVSFIDQSFGFETAVYATNSVITAAHNEAKGALNGVGLIHVMGRDSGFIAASATLANSLVNYCLIPEENFTLGDDGPRDLVKNLFERLAQRKHAVIIVAEGAGQYLFESGEEIKDKSGNVLHRNIGLYLKAQLQKFAKKRNAELNIKYFDPSYMIRSLPAYGTDAVFCLMLAQNAVHAAMSGRTDMVVGHWHDHFTHVPIPLATKERKKINPSGPLWRSVKAITWHEYGA
jgi:6-phosphofructokinase 1